MAEQERVPTLDQFPLPTITPPSRYSHKQLVEERGGSPTQRPLQPGSRNGRELIRHEDWLRIRASLGLSPRELQLVQHIFEGNTLSDIAQDMQLALGTVKTYVQRVYRKLEISSQRELAMVVMIAYVELATR